MTRTCSDCPAPISKWSQGRCRTCVFFHVRTNPEIQARRLARLREAKKTPEHRRRQSEARLKLEAERASDPEWQAMKKRSGRAGRDRFEASQGAEGRRVAALSAANKARSAAAIAWCPEDRHGEYKKLRQQVGAVEARRILEADLAAIEKRRLAALTPLQRQIERLQNGATLVEKPVFRRADPDFSLTGNAMGML